MIWKTLFPVNKFTLKLISKLKILVKSPANAC